MKNLHNRFMLALLLVVMAAGCSGAPKSFTYRSEADELKSGPGLFSGEKGYYIIHRKPDGANPKSDGTEEKTHEQIVR